MEGFGSKKKVWESINKSVNKNHSQIHSTLSDFLYARVAVTYFILCLFLPPGLKIVQNIFGDGSLYFAMDVMPWLSGSYKKIICFSTNQSINSELNLFITIN